MSSTVHDVKISSPTCTPAFKQRMKSYGFAIAIIVSIGGLGMIAAGVAGYFHVGALTKLSQAEAISIMAAGVMALVVGVIGAAKISTMKHQLPVLPSAIDKNNTIYIPERSIYPREAWRVWDIEFLDKVPKMPNIVFDTNKEILLYIPKRIRFKGEEANFSLKTLQKICSDNKIILEIDDNILAAYGDTTSSGWILINKTLVEGSRGHGTVRVPKDSRLPKILEAVTVNVIAFAWARERLYSANPLTYTYCSEMAGSYPILVGGFTERVLKIACKRRVHEDDLFEEACGFAAVRDLSTFNLNATGS